MQSEKIELNGYDLSRGWFNLCAERCDIKTQDTALYFYIIELCNSLTWKKEFGLPTVTTMSILNIGSYKTYKNSLNKLIEVGVLKMVTWSKNHHHSNIVALVNYTEVVPKQMPKQDQSKCQSTSSINKPLNKETIKPINKEKGSAQKESINNSIPKKEEKKKEPNGAKKEKCTPDNPQQVIDYLLSENLPLELSTLEANKFFDHFESNGWKVGGKTPMKKWKASIRNWMRNGKKYANETKGYKTNDQKRAEYTERSDWLQDKFMDAI